ncbi:hypothetical protein ACXITP_06365 [Actinotignum sanguinis]|uniref:Uncharacterized protein n=3 Tax=Actinomycetaceae TaxID=2049 RepID=A0ABZ0RCY5_9ACTO|nr:hypothetical protein [Actinotignum sanguinis]WPJ88865.1 hypothetical protein R0V15_08385 [Schaalia turicensis]MDE1656491.1 hypothetical protein [Actinotignum sanguinis]MDK8512459.1 hypothetical protein [Actinotignum sanguinis]MDK8518678.1 hypothetical protein [Actinotignum sanguinis]MDK8747942.1 hypothetical protein [Actinotignum sanguinis]
MMWGILFSFFADDFDRIGRFDVEIISEIVLLAVSALWSFSRRYKENWGEVLHAGLYMGVCLALVAINNSSWTRFAVIILAACYALGYLHRAKKAQHPE